MSYECSCGATFRTLSRKRLHQRDECPDRDMDLDVADLDVDAIAASAVAELLICDVCGASNDGAEDYDHDYTNAGLSFVLRFTCDHCGAWNENTAIMSGGSA